MTVREAKPEDLAAITHVRTSVEENHLSIAQMAERGITREGIIADLAYGRLGGWVAEEDGRIVAFSMAKRDEGQIFALFTLPGFERRGHGTRLLDEALAFLKRQGHARASLSTGRDTVAERFYIKRGWIPAGDDPDNSDGVLFTKEI